MAEYGLQIKNAGGFLVIDGTYSNLGIRSSGTLDMSNAAQNTNGCFYKTFTITANTPIIALSGGYAAISSMAISGTTLTFTVWALSRANQIYYLFDEAMYCARFNTNYGLVVKNKSTGLVVYDSRIKYMRVLDVISGSGSTGVITRSYPGVQKVAVVQCAKYAFGETVIIPTANPPFTQPYLNTGASSVTSNNVASISEISVFNLPPSQNNPIVLENNQDFFFYLVVDVSYY